jgi:BMFP domain-containing protein YqiC
MNEENIQELTKDKNKFLEYSKKIEDKFDGPSAYFYKRVINEIRTNNYTSLFDKNIFFEYLYATLASWGMHRMDKNTRMADFNYFKDNIIKNKELFIKLSKEELQKSDLNALKEIILRIFNSLNVMSREDAPKFVANSKIMHFLLPDLIPPMDKGHILYFFYGQSYKNKRGKIVKKYPNIKNNEDVYFWEILNQFQIIANKLSLGKDDLKNEWDTSIPKIIDNAIIGFNLKE